jgi:hypothetical protein
MPPPPETTIRIEKPEAALAETMAAIRSWLDQHRIAAIRFKIERTALLPNIAFDIQFRSADEAVLFERVFA